MNYKEPELLKQFIEIADAFSEMKLFVKEAEQQVTLEKRVDSVPALCIHNLAMPVNLICGFSDQRSCVVSTELLSPETIKQKLVEGFTSQLEPGERGVIVMDKKLSTMLPDLFD